MREILVALPNPPPGYERSRTMPYSSGGRAFGMAHNPWYFKGKKLRGKKARSIRMHIARTGAAPKGFAFRKKGSKKRSTARAVKRLARHKKRATALHRAGGKKMRRRAGALKAAITRKRKAAARRSAGLKAARTRKRKSMAKRGKSRGKRGARSSRKGRSTQSRRSRSLRRRPKITRTKVRAVVARVKRGKRGKGRYVFLVSKSKRRSLRGKRWAKRKILYNPGSSTGGGFMATLKSVFTFETVKVVGGGLAGFTISAGLGEALARAVVKDPIGSHTSFVLVGAGAGVVAAVGGGVLISRYSPTVGRAFLWGGLLGTAIRALAAAFPGKGLDMPRSAAEADKLAMKLHMNEISQAGAGTPAAGLLAAASQAAQGAKEYMHAGRGGYVSDANDYLTPGPGARDYLQSGEMYSHPAAGSGQTW